MHWKVLLLSLLLLAAPGPLALAGGGHADAPGSCSVITGAFEVVTSPKTCAFECRAGAAVRVEGRGALFDIVGDCGVIVADCGVPRVDASPPVCTDAEGPIPASREGNCRVRTMVVAYVNVARCSGT